MPRLAISVQVRRRRCNVHFPRRRDAIAYFERAPLCGYLMKMEMTNRAGDFEERMLSERVTGVMDLSDDEWRRSNGPQSED